MLALQQSNLDHLEEARRLLLEEMVDPDDPMLNHLIGEIGWRKHLVGDKDAERWMFASVIPILGGKLTEEEVRNMYYKYISLIRSEWLNGRKSEARQIIREAAKPALSNSLFRSFVPSATGAIASQQVDKGNPVVAEPLYLEAIAISEEDFGKSKEYYQLRFSLTYYLFHQSRYEEADEIAKAIIEELSVRDLGTFFAVLLVQLMDATT